MSPHSSFLVVCLLPLAASAAEPAPPDPATAPAADAAATTAPVATPAPVAATGNDAAHSAAAETLVLTDREAEYARIAPHLAVGDELRWLEVESRKFVALIRKPRQGPPRGALLIVPAPEELVDRREPVRSLRMLPPAGGFVTLALQPPLGAIPVPAEAAAAPPQAAADADAAATPEAQAAVDTEVPAAPVHPEFCPRVAAALTALRAALTPPADGAAPPLVAIVAADASVPVVLGCYTEGLPADVSAFAALGRWSGDFGGLAVPSIEFVPLRDPVAVKAADARAALPLAAAAPARRRVDVEGVDSRLEGAGEDIAKRLRGWLEHLPPPSVAKTAAATPPPVSS